MSLLKKWASCVISFIAGVCGLALSACSGMVVKTVFPESLAAYDIKSSTETTKAFKVLTDKELYTQAKEAGIGSEFMVMKVFAIITLIISVLLIAYAIVMLLKNLNVIKFESKIFDIVGISLIAVLLVATIGLLISSNNYANEMEKVVKADVAVGMKQLETLIGSAINWKLTISVGVYQPTMLVISIISALAVGTFTFLNKKSA